MKILELKDLKNYKHNSVVTLGFFDGLHLGHVKIIEKLIEVSKLNNFKSVVITFDNSVLNMFKMTKNIVSVERKLEYLKSLKVDYVLLLKTKDNFMGLSADEFKDNVLEKLQCKHIVCGNDFSFARAKQGNIEYIKNNTNYGISLVDDVYYENIKVSSTYIRNLLSSGNVVLANKLLFKPLTITSNIVEGFRIGRTIGFKTANINVTDSCYLLKHGVYFGKVVVDNKEYKTMINVGINPTINYDNSLKVEAHILDFNDDIYYKYIDVIFEKYYRDEIKFDELSKLKEQLEIDLKNLKEY